MTTAQDALRHLVASLRFRFEHVTEGVPDNFGDFVAGAEVRTPCDIVRHMSGLAGLVHEQFVAFQRERLEPLPWAEEKARLLEALAFVDADFAEGTLREDAALSLERILQGSLNRRGDPHRPARHAAAARRVARDKGELYRGGDAGRSG